MEGTFTRFKKNVLLFVCFFSVIANSCSGLLSRLVHISVPVSEISDWSQNNSEIKAYTCAHFQTCSMACVMDTASDETCVICRFWTKLHDLCPLSDGGGLPLSSAFCQGHGNAFFCMGQVQRMTRSFVAVFLCAIEMKSARGKSKMVRIDNWPAFNAQSTMKSMSGRGSRKRKKKKKVGKTSVTLMQVHAHMHAGTHPHTHTHNTHTLFTFQHTCCCRLPSSPSMLSNINTDFCQLFEMPQHDFTRHEVESCKCHFSQYFWLSVHKTKTHTIYNWEAW